MSKESFNSHSHPTIMSYQDSFFRESLSLDTTHDVFTNVSVAQECRELARRISEAAIPFHDEFPFLYFTSGATEAINYYFLTRKTFYHDNDYRYVQLFKKPPLKAAEVSYYSFPFAGTGLFSPPEKTKPLVVDCAYYFASNMRIKIPQSWPVHSVIFSLSKSHNLADLRLGWFLSREKIEIFHTLQYEYGYINSLFYKALNTVLSKPLNYLYLKYKDSLTRSYSINNLFEPDTNLFGLTPNNKRVPYYLLR